MNFASLNEPCISYSFTQEVDGSIERMGTMIFCDKFSNPFSLKIQNTVFEDFQVRFSSSKFNFIIKYQIRNQH